MLCTIRPYSGHTAAHVLPQSSGISILPRHVCVNRTCSGIVCMSVELDCMVTLEADTLSTVCIPCSVQFVLVPRKRTPPPLVKPALAQPRLDRERDRDRLPVRSDRDYRDRSGCKCLATDSSCPAAVPLLLLCWVADGAFMHLAWQHTAQAKPCQDISFQLAAGHKHTTQPEADLHAASGPGALLPSTKAHQSESPGPECRRCHSIACAAAGIGTTTAGGCCLPHPGA